MKNKFLIITTAVVLIIAIIVIIVIPSNKTSKTTNNASRVIDAYVNEDGNVEINFDDLDTSNATFINYKLNDTTIELAAIINVQGNVDVAFNTCQVCNGSPRAYFIQQNDQLICQNCGNAFSLSSIGSMTYGCNPMTIDTSDLTKEDAKVIISQKFLNQNEDLFINVAQH